MSIEQGTLTYRAFGLAHPITINDIGRFAINCAPPIEALTNNAISGWVTGRHLLDRNITPESAYYGGYLRLSLLKAERNVPTAQLRAECKIEELAMLSATGRQALSRNERMEIRQAVYDRLLPTMPVTLKGIDFVAGTDRLFATATSEKQTDALSIHFAQTLGYHIVPVIPATMAKVGEWPTARFADGIEEVVDDAGADFLTWLWFISEECGGELNPVKLGAFFVMIEGPLHLTGGLGACDVVIKRGEPRLSAESKSALLAGKKLCRAKVTFAFNSDLAFTCGLTSDFGVYALRMPLVEKIDKHSAFEERMTNLGTFQCMLEGAFGLFAALRNDAVAWERTLAEMREWIINRKVRRD